MKSKFFFFFFEEIWKVKKICYSELNLTFKDEKQIMKNKLSRLRDEAS